MNWCRGFNCAVPAAERSAFPLMKIWLYIIQQVGHVRPKEPHESVPARSSPRGLRVSSSFVAIKATFWIYAKSQFKLDRIKILLILCGDQIFLTQKEKKPYYNNALLVLTFSL